MRPRSYFFHARPAFRVRFGYGFGFRFSFRPRWMLSAFGLAIIPGPLTIKEPQRKPGQVVMANGAEMKMKGLLNK